MNKDRQSQFFEWLVGSVSSAQLSELYQAFTYLEDALSSHKFPHHLAQPLAETTDAGAVNLLYNELSNNRQFMRSYRSNVKLALLGHYARFCRENPPASKDDNRQADVSSGDVLIDRLNKDGIPYVDNRPKNGALWVPPSPKTEKMLKEAEAQDIHFAYSASRQQWWTRDESPKENAHEALDPAITKRNQQAFIKWLRDEGFETLDQYSIYRAVQEIHTLLLEDGIAHGLFGITNAARVQVFAAAAKDMKAFIAGDIAEKHAWTKALNCYLRFVESAAFVSDPVQAEPAPPAPQPAPSAAETAPHQAQPSAARPAGHTITEDGFREWLKQNRPAEQADLIVKSIRGAEQFARRNHVHGIKIFGVDPSAMQNAVNHMLVSRAFYKDDTSLYQGFKQAASLLAAYKAAFLSASPAQAERAPVADSQDEVSPVQSPAKEEEADTAPSPSLSELLQGDRFAQLRDALISKGITTIEALKRFNLWVFMNQNGLYTIGERQTVYSAVLRALASEGSSGANAGWKLITLRREYVSSSPAGALVEYCRAMAAKYPLRFRGLVGQRFNGTDVIPLSRTRRNESDLRLDNPEAYVAGDLDAETARSHARWIAALCRDDDLPQLVTRVAAGNEGAEATENKPGSHGAAMIGQLASLTSNDDYAFTTPLSVTYKGVTTPVDHWASVFQEVCRRLYADHKVRMVELVTNDSIMGVAGYFANENSKRDMRSPRAFAPGCYFESNLSATDTMHRICSLLRYFDATDQFEIRYRRLATKPVPPTPGPEKPPEKPPMQDKPSVVSPYQERVEDMVLTADLAGMTLDQVHDKMPFVTMVALKQIRDHSTKLVDIAERLIHVDAFVDWEDGAQKLEEILEKLLTRNNGYVSYSQLYEYARAEMRMFLNDNDMDDARKVFDMAQHLFEKEGYHGKRYTFWMKAHISRSKESVTSNLDVIKKFARDNNGFFRYDDLEEYLEQVGVKSGNLRGQMLIGSKPVFFYYSSEELLSAESMRIDDAWLDQARKALERLFADVGDHVALRTINPIWYEQLPTLPGYLPWTPLLLQYIIQFYGKELNAKTIGSELNQKYDVLHAVLVTPDSEVQTFADAVAAYLVDSGIEQRQFEAEALRKLLVDGGLIAGNELIWKMPKAIGHDPRFAWDASGDKVNIKV